MDLHRDAWRTEFKMLSSFISHSFERIKINNKKKNQKEKERRIKLPENKFILTK